MAQSIAVVISQGQSHNPAKRKLEEELVATLLMETGVNVTVVPHLYDLAPDGTGMLCLEGIKGDLILCSWMFPRAAHWILNRNGIFGHVGTSLLTVEGEGGPDDDTDEDTDDSEGDESRAGETAEADSKLRVIDEKSLPNRKIYCLDFRASTKPEDYVEEIRRIASEASTDTVGLTDWIGGSPQADQMKRFLNPAAGNVASNGNGSSNGNGNGKSDHSALPPISPTQSDSEAVVEPIVIQEEPDRRWYPVIDFSRCTNCMECIDFCLFGVYGVDKIDTILVEQPDNCRKGCPACSRVCPENAIIFPQHKSPGIAGSADVEAGGLKIDLSKLFGAPDVDAVDMAVLERDEQLAKAGRDTVGKSVGLAKRQPTQEQAPKDNLDNLMDELDNLDL